MVQEWLSLYKDILVLPLVVGVQDQVLTMLGLLRKQDEAEEIDTWQYYMHEVLQNYPVTKRPHSCELQRPIVRDILACGSKFEA
jgi:hypothetical protein